MKKATSLSKKRIWTLEERLALLCMETKLSKGQEVLILKHMNKNLDWSYFYQFASKHKIFPLVYKNLSGLQELNSEEQILYKLREDYRNNQFLSLLLTNELLRLVDALNQKDIKVLVLKGPILSMSLYQDLSMRHSRDIDILISPSDRKETEEILKELGYINDLHYKLSPKQDKLLLKSSHHLTYHNSKGILPEIHFRLSKDYYNAPFEELWIRRKELRLYGRVIHVLKDEENLVYLILHGSKHGWKRLKWLCDINLIVKNESLDWIYILHLSKELGMYHILLQTLILLKVVFRTQVPVQIPTRRREEVHGHRLAILSLTFIRCLDQDAELPGHSLYKLYKNYMLSWHISPFKKLVYLLRHLIPTEEEFRVISLPDPCFSLYYLFRFCKIIARLFIIFLQFLFGRRIRWSNKKLTPVNLTYNIEFGRIGNSMNKYKAFGLIIETELVFTELLPYVGEEVDVTIIKGTVPEAVNDLVVDTPTVKIGKDCYLWDIKNLAKYLVKQGSVVILEPYKGATFEEIKHYLLGSCMGALLYQRRILPIHGSCIHVKGEGLLLTGESGAGKSTVAAIMTRKGYKVLSDDVTPVIQSEQGILMAYPSYPSQKLWHDAVQRIGIEEKVGPLHRISKDFHKYSLNINLHYEEKPIPLKVIIEIVPSDSQDLKITEIRGSEKLELVSKNCYRRFLVDAMELREWHFTLCLALAQKTKILRIERPKKKPMEQIIADLVLEKIWGID